MKRFLRNILCSSICCLIATSGFAQEPPTSGLSKAGANQRFKKALELFEQKEYTQAVAALSALRAQYVELVDYIDFFVIRAHIQEENHAEALMLSQSFLTRFPSHPLANDVSLFEASSLMKLQRFQDAAALYRELIQQRKIPEKEMLYPLGEALLALEMPEDAANTFQKLVHFYPAHSDANAARKVLQRIIASHSELRSVWSEDTLFAYAERLMESGVYSLAITQHKQFQSQYPESVKFGESELGLAQGYLRLRKTKEGTRLLEQIVECYADSRPEIAAEALYMLGRRAWNADRNQEAKGLMQRILTDFRASAWGDDASYVLGRIYQSWESYQAAAQCYRSLATRYPDSPLAEEALFRAGWSLYLAQNYSKACQLFELAAKVFPAGDYLTNGHFWKGKSLEAAGKRDAAAEAYRLTIHAEPDTYYAALAQDRLSALTGKIPSRQWISGETPTLSELVAALQPKISMALYQEVLEHSRKALTLHRLDLSRYARGEIEWIGDRLETQISSSAENEWQTWILYFQARLYEAIDEHLPAIRLAYRIADMQKTGSVSAFPYTLAYLQYPLRYQKQIRKYAAERALDPFLVASLIRQESAYNAEVISPAGARGLMQIMPATGKRVARAIGLRKYSTKRLFEPEVNLAIGAAYLADMLEEFNGNVFRSLAAYNAGPKATNKWWTAENAGQEEEIVENISYNETRNYVKYVLRNYEQYRRLYPELGSAE